MKRTIDLLLIVAVAGLIGCASDQPGAPLGGEAPIGSYDKAVGPSEVVLALDVSTAVDASALAAVIESLGAALADGDLFPAAGTISLGAYVYGDTIAAPFDGLVAVTDDNLQNVILPALSGLETDRLVTGDRAELAAALTAAGDLLAAAGQAADRHVLVVGSGAAADTLAVNSACAALSEAGVMVSAVGLGEGAPLASCAEATGGWFAGMVEDLGAAIGEALGYMLRVDLDLAGSATELERGADFIATATFFRGGDPDAYPLRERAVDFTIVTGPNAGGPFAAVTDTFGTATLSYTGDGGPGTDVIVASALHPGTGVALTDTVAVTWLNTPPSCDPGGPYLATVDADTVMIELDASASFDADGDTLTFAWSVVSDGASLEDAAAAMPRLTLTGAALCADTLIVALDVSDGHATTSCEAVVVLDDQRPPVVETLEEPLVLWPPNHKHATFTPDMFIVRAEDACGRPLDPSAVSVVAVHSDEPDDARGDGRTVDDIVIMCPDVVKLRAERMGGGNGRVYTIDYRLTGDNGQSAEFSATVVVPHDESGRDAGQDPVGGFTVTADCADGD